jgi:hypothetical protein
MVPRKSTTLSKLLVRQADVLALSWFLQIKRLLLIYWVVVRPQAKELLQRAKMIIERNFSVDIQWETPRQSVECYHHQRT